MSILEIFAVVVSIIGVLLTVKRNIYCWLFNFVAFILYAYIFYQYKLYAETILQFIFVAMAVYGFYNWKKTSLQDAVIRIEDTRFPSSILHILFASALGLLLGLSLHYLTDASLAILDAQLAAFSLLATYWTSKKYIATWLLWIIVDIVYVAMFMYKELYLTAALYAVFIGLAVIGWRQWLAARQSQIKLNSMNY